MPKGFATLIGLLIAVIIMIFLFVIINKVYTKNSTVPNTPAESKQLQNETQNTIDQYQQKSIQNQQIEIE